MEFLSPEEEALLQECLDRADDFPNVLAEKFDGLSVQEDEQLRSCIKVLCDNGYLSKLQWADDVPFFGRIEQKGRNYFRQKEIYIRAKLRQDPYFILLDDESESMLRDLIQAPEMYVTVTGDAAQGRVIEHLGRCGLVSYGAKGLSYDFSGGFVGVVSVTQKGKNYFTDKEHRIEEIMVLGDEAFVVNNIDRQYNVSGNTISNSPIQIGDGNSQEIDYSDCEDKLSELKEEIASLRLSDEQQETLSRLISKAEDECNRKNGGAVKKILGEIWDFAKQAGSNLLATYLAVLFKLG